MTHNWSTKYHASSVERALNFQRTYENPELRVDSQLSSVAETQREQYKTALNSIVKTILFIGIVKYCIPEKGNQRYGSVLRAQWTTATWSS